MIRVIFPNKSARLGNSGATCSISTMTSPTAKISTGSSSEAATSATGVSTTTSAATSATGVSTTTSAAISATGVSATTSAATPSYSSLKSVDRSSTSGESEDCLVRRNLSSENILRSSLATSPPSATAKTFSIICIHACSPIVEITGRSARSAIK